MLQNPTHFQRGMSLNGFLYQHAGEAWSRAALLRARWPEGLVCVRRGDTADTRFPVEWRCY